MKHDQSLPTIIAMAEEAKKREDIAGLLKEINNQGMDIMSLLKRNTKQVTDAMSFFYSFAKKEQDKVKSKENLTVGDARVSILKASMFKEAGELANEGVDVENMPTKELQLLIKEKLRVKQAAGEYQFPLFDWYLEIFERKEPQNHG